VTVRETAGARDLGRYNKLRAITLQGGLAPGYTLGEALDIPEAEAAKAPEVTAVGYRGESQAFREAGSSILIVFALTILVVYLVARRAVRELRPSAVIITTVPLAVGGGVIGLALMGRRSTLTARSASSCWSAWPPRTAS
jgi:multidrug efflux pump